MLRSGVCFYKETCAVRIAKDNMAAVFHSYLAHTLCHKRLHSIPELGACDVAFCNYALSLRYVSHLSLRYVSHLSLRYVSHNSM
jgi:hypothetical protein